MADALLRKLTSQAASAAGEIAAIPPAFDTEIGDDFTPVAPPKRRQPQPRPEAAPVPKEGGSSFSRLELDTLAGLLTSAETTQLALEMVASRDNAVRLTLTVVAVLCMVASFGLQSVTKLEDNERARLATMVLTAIGAGATLLVERMPQTRRSIKLKALSDEWRTLARTVEESLYFGMDSRYKSSQKLLKALSSQFTALAVKSPSVDQTTLELATGRQKRMAQTRAPRRASRMFPVVSDSLMRRTDSMV